MLKNGRLNVCWHDYTNKDESFALLSNQGCFLDVRCEADWYCSYVKLEEQIVATGLKKRTKEEAMKEAEDIGLTWLIRVSRMARSHGIGVKV